jgi:hypothetical protein
MRKYALKLIVVCAALCAAGCTTAPSPDVLASADYGTFPSNYLDVIHAYQETRLKDPSSAQTKVVIEPRKAWAKWNNQTVYGYRTCIAVNAKNSFGAFTGPKLTSVFFRDGRLLRYDQEQSGDDAVTNVCKALAGSAP